MKVLSNNRFFAPVSLTSAFGLAVALLLHASAAPMPHTSGNLGQAMALRAAVAPKGETIPSFASEAATALSAPSAHLAGYYRNNSAVVAPSLASQARLSGMALPHDAAGVNPVILEPYSATEVVDIKDAAGNVVRAPGSTTNASAAINEPTPNQPLTFTVQLGTNNIGGSTTATPSAVYIQFKNPNSLYQDINVSGTGTREHKVFTEDSIDYSNAETAMHNAGETGLPDSGSATAELYNGQTGQPPQTFSGSNIPTQTDFDRGAVGGFDSLGNITVGLVNPPDQSPLNPITVKDNNIVHTLPGIDTSASIDNGGGFGAPSVEAKFHAWGQEYECQYVDPHQNTNSLAPSGYGTSFYSTLDTTNSDYGTPYYLAGYDDQQPGSFPGVPTNPVTGDTEWLKLNPIGNDQYSATWSPPESPSDYYMDVIVVDNQNDWRIYDNIWGFSTLPFNPVHDILFVADNVLGQKFGASASGENNTGPANLRPIFYGAESYFTDYDTALLPNATEYWEQVTGRTPVYDNPTTHANEFTTDQIPVELIQGLGFNYNFNADYGDSNVTNGLGYDSYDDETTDREMVYPVPDPNNQFQPMTGSDSVQEPRSDAYSIWRILCRGRVPQSVYADYEPSFVSEPAVSDPLTGFTSPAANGTAEPKVINATRCILWAAPFAGDQPLNVAGSITDPNVQTDLTDFVNAGGRLMVNGQEVASALTLNGQVDNGPGSFIYNVLNAELKTTGSNSIQNQIITGVTGIGNQISFDSFLNFLGPGSFDAVYSNFLQITPANNGGFTFIFKSPADDSPLFLGNNFDLTNNPPDYAQWRTDGALTQLGPVTTLIGQSTIQGKVNSITPENGAITNFSNTDGPSVVYKSNYTSAMGSGYGSRVVFSSMGLEGIGSEYYQQSANNQFYIFPRNERTDILHNVVSYLRTGTFRGVITESTGTGVGVAGATVYLRPFRVGSTTLPGPRQTYSATTSDGTNEVYTNTDGTSLAGTTIPLGGYEIDGVEPGLYQVFVYKTGFNEDSSPIENSDAFPYAVSGDTTATVNLNLTPLANGAVTGTVTNSSTGAVVAGATVTFTSSDGVVTQSTTTASDGTYSISLPPGNYTGVATETNPTANSPTSGTVTVNSGSTTSGVNFQITINPGTITGTVTDGSGGPGINGATVAFTAQSSTTPAATVTTSTINGVAGSYQSSGLPPGTYTITASDPGFVETNSTPVTATVTAGQTATASAPIVLGVAPSATLNITLTNSSGAPITDATVSLTDLAGNSVASTITTSGSTGVYTGTVQEGDYIVTISATSYQTLTENLNVTTNPTNVSYQLTAAAPVTTFPGGGAGTPEFSMISWPYNYIPSGSNAFDDVFGPLETSGANGNRSHAYVYDAAIGNYITDPGFPADGLRAGYGYFIALKNPVSVYTGAIQGTPPTYPVAVPLQEGWNMIGDPSLNSYSVASIQVEINGTLPVSLGQAVSLYNAVYGTLYGYTPGGSYYTLGENSQLQPFQGYWIYARVPNVTLEFPANG